MQYCLESQRRCIPSVVDGLKPVERKIMYTAFKKNICEDTNVVVFGGNVSELTDYLQGHESVEGSIIRYSQNYVDSNNINLLNPSSQFGSRLKGGSDHGNARYLDTKFTPIARLIFRPEDDTLLERLHGVKQNFIEPKCFIPIIPLILVNGTRGIASASRTYVPPHDPIDVINYLEIEIDVVMTKDQMGIAKAVEGGLINAFNLTTDIDLDEMNLYNVHGSLNHYSNLEEILEEYFTFRLAYYDTRKSSMLKKITKEIQKTNTVVRFLERVADGEIFKINPDLFENDMAEHEYKKFPEEGREDEIESYEYLRRMPCENYSALHLYNLKLEMNQMKAEKRKLQNTSASGMWLDELKPLKEALQEQRELV